MRSGVVWCVAAAMAAGLAVDVAVAVVAARRGTDLTMLRYVLLRGGGGGVPGLAALQGWMQTFQGYFSHAAYFWVVVVAWVLAVRNGRRDAVAATLALWWGLMSLAVVRYATGLEAAGMQAAPSSINASMVALPSYLLVAYFCGSLVQHANVFLRFAGLAVCAAVVVPMGVQTVQGRGLEGLQGSYYLTHRSQCQMVKAASYYVRAYGRPDSTVFHLTSAVALGHFGEFYYGISYGANARTGERNRLVDFGGQALGRARSAREMAAAYGVRHFDYYVQFADDEGPLVGSAVDELRGEGAMPVLEVTSDGRVIGRVWSFDSPSIGTLPFREAAQRWDTSVYLRDLIRQPLAGTAYHFGYA
jgi:hypothetical protein